MKNIILFSLIFLFPWLGMAQRDFNYSFYVMDGLSQKVRSDTLKIVGVFLLEKDRDNFVVSSVRNTASVLYDGKMFYTGYLSFCTCFRYESTDGFEIYVDPMRSLFWIESESYGLGNFDPMEMDED